MAARKRLKKLYSLHAWLGFQLALVMSVILVTGTIATVSNEIDWLLFDALHRDDSVVETQQPVTSDDWAAIYASLKTSYPQGEVRYLLDMGESYLTHRALIENEALSTSFVQIDPASHRVTGVMPRLTVQRFFRDFHRYLFMPAFPGILFVCAFAFVLALSLYTGLKTTRNWKTALCRLRLNHGARIALSDLHKVLGLWGVWFVALITVTGLWYFYEFSFQLVGSRLEPRPPAIETPQTENRVSISVEDFQQMVQLAQSSHVDWEITSILLPTDNTKPAEFRGVGSNPLLRDRAYRVFINPQTFEVIDVFSPHTIGVNAYLNEYADPLHFGNFGGFVSKLIWFVFGIGLSAMSITGVLMTWKRTKSRILTKQQIKTLPIILLTLVAFFFWVQRYL
ncbi:PepSY-associated TM helix domain-containing protein [Alteromonas sp. P256]|uniref:PepSY-associated TM helix domain-containing protein n=1 Tax=Alteromonas sp. P256 TaxID=3117399 RepID=UPI002FDF23DB